MTYVSNEEKLKNDISPKDFLAASLTPVKQRCSQHAPHATETVHRTLSVQTRKTITSFNIFWGWKTPHQFPWNMGIKAYGIPYLQEYLS